MWLERRIGSAYDGGGTLAAHVVENNQ